MPVCQRKTIVKIKVIPQAKHNQIEYMRIEEIADKNLLSAKIRVTAAPQNNAANEAIVALLSSKFKLSRACIEIVKGHKNRNKLIIIYGSSLSELLTSFNEIKR